MKRRNILILDDEDRLREDLGYLLPGKEYKLHWETSLTKAEGKLRQNSIHLVLLDLHLGKDSSPPEGLNAMKTIQEKFPMVPIIVISKYRRTGKIVQAIREGAKAYLYKGEMDPRFWKTKIDQVSESAFQISKQLELLKRRPEFVGRSQLMKEFISELDLVAQQRSDLLIMGEPGLRKRLITRYLIIKGGYFTRRFRSFLLDDEVHLNDLFFYLDPHGRKKIEDSEFFTETQQGILHLHIPRLEHDKVLFRMLGALFLKRKKRRKSSSPITGPDRILLTTHPISSQLQEPQTLLNLPSLTVPKLAKRHQDIVQIAKRMTETLEYKKVSFNPDVIRILQDNLWHENFNSLEKLLEGALKSRRHEGPVILTSKDLS